MLLLDQPMLQVESTNRLLELNRLTDKEVITLYEDSRARAVESGILNNNVKIHNIDLSSFSESDKYIILCTFGLDRSRVLTEIIVQNTILSCPLNYEEHQVHGLAAGTIEFYEDDDLTIRTNRGYSHTFSLEDSVKILLCSDIRNPNSSYIPDMMSMIILIERVLRITGRNVSITIIEGSEQDLFIWSKDYFEM